MKRILPILLSLLLLTGCGGTSADGYQQISQEEAKEMMDTNGSSLRRGSVIPVASRKFSG